jgi:acyl dehydratase
METYRYFEDFAVGDQYETASIPVSEADIIGFAEHFDPQPMHLGGANLIASGWHTAALTMRLFVICDECRPPPGSLGLGVSKLTWSRPVRPGDRLHIRIEVLTLRRSASHPGHGIATYRFSTFNQNGELVQTMESSMLLPCHHG